MNWEDFKHIQTRRHFMKECAGGLGTLALWHLLAQEGRTEALGDMPNSNPLAPKPPNFAPKAKNVIFLFMSGAPSQVDLLDPKPELKKWEGHPLPPSMTKNLRLAFIKPTAEIWASPRVFKQYGQSGLEFSDYLPHTAKCADDICMIRSMYTEQFNHFPGALMLNCGSPLVGRPSMGAWVIYGLGSESQNLPGFVLSSGDPSPAGCKQWSSGFLPSSYEGVPFRNSGDPVLYLSNPPGVSKEMQRARLDAVRDLNEQVYVDTGDIEIASRIASYELAFRMQAAAPELLDLSKESAATIDMYGINNHPDNSALQINKTDPTRFAVNCLLARRLVERGVRFVELIHSSWDDHSELNHHLKSNCEMTDQPVAALLTDLKQRGLLDSTLVVWGGEFGRTPMVEKSTHVDNGDSRGRDHHPFAFSLWMAGGGVKGGQVIGKTDDLGLTIVEEKVDIHDLHATMLQCIGLDHKRLTYRHQGRDFRLTDVAGNVIEKALT